MSKTLHMSDQQTSSTGLREVLIETVREAVRAELKAFGAQPHIEDRLLDAEAAAKLLSVSTDWLYHNSRNFLSLVSLGTRCCASRISGFKNIFRANSFRKLLTGSSFILYVLDTVTGKQMREARKRLGMTQKELGEALGVHWNSVARMERDEFPIIRTTELAIKFLLITEKQRRKKGDE